MNALIVQDLKRKIGEHPGLKGLAPEQLEVVARHAREVTFGEGQILFHQNESSYAFFLIQEGRVAIESYVPRGENIPVQVVGAGDVLGWSWLFPPFTWHFQARAITACSAIFIDGASLLVACENDANLGYEIIHRIAQIVIQRLQVTRRHLLELEGAEGLKGQWNRLRVRPAAANAPTKSLRERLAAHPFLQGLRPEFLEILAENAMAKDFEAGESIFDEGGVANRFYLIEQGAIVLEASRPDGKRAPIEVLGGGDVLGWSWLFPPFYWHFDARAAEEVKCIFIYGTRLRSACEANHAFGYEIMKRVCQVVIERLQMTRKQLLAVTACAEASNKNRISSGSCDREAVKTRNPG